MDIGGKVNGSKDEEHQDMEVNIIVKQSCPKLVDQNVTIMLRECCVQR